MSDITRTFISTVATLKLFDNGNDEIISKAVDFPGKLELADIKKYVAKSPDFSWATLLKVSSISYNETLRGMSEQTFMEHGKPFDTRTKETRGMISKEIIATVAACVTVDNESMNVDSVDYVLPRKMTPGEAKRFINKRDLRYTVVKCDIIEVKQLYAMPVETFIEFSEILPPRKVSEK